MSIQARSRGCVSRQGLQDHGGGLAEGLVSSASSTSRQRFLRRCCEAGSVGVGGGRRCGCGLIQGMVHLEFLRRWKMIAGSGAPQRRCRMSTSESRSKRSGDVLRPTIHSDKCDAVRGSACLEAHNAVLLLWLSLGSWFGGDVFFSFPTDAPATAVAEDCSRSVGGCKDQEDFFCNFFLLLAISLGVLYLWISPQICHVCCNLLILLI